MIDRITPLKAPAKYSALTKPTMPLYASTKGGTQTRPSTTSRNGEIAAAAIDVLPEEPPVDGNPLLDYEGDNLIVTPHIAWSTDRARQEAIAELAANVAAFLGGEQRNRVV